MVVTVQRRQGSALPIRPYMESFVDPDLASKSANDQQAEQALLKKE